MQAKKKIAWVDTPWCRKSTERATSWLDIEFFLADDNDQVATDC